MTPNKGKKPAKDRAGFILEQLSARYPNPRSMLDWKTPWELLVATVLAAQCTDARVNTVTPGFFRRWPGPAELAQARVEDIEDVVHPTGFFRNKARNLLATARILTEKCGGEPPRTMEELTTLPGVARKTANIVLSGAYGLFEGIAVDTHVRRLSFRLGLTESQDPVRIEKDLMPLFPRESWGDVNHGLVLFGREVCTARKPRCGGCPLDPVCPRKGVEA